jgi:hypothetical protein
VEAVLRAFEAGRFDAGEWDASAGRIERLRAAAEFGVGAGAADGGDTGVIGCEEHRALSEAAFRRVSEVQG